MEGGNRVATHAHEISKKKLFKQCVGTPKRGKQGKKKKRELSISSSRPSSYHEREKPRQQQPGEDEDDDDACHGEEQPEVQGKHHA